MTDATAGKIPHVLVIMDGVGHREAVEDNAFLAAKTPNLTMMQEKHPHSLISGSGEDVGLPDGQMGNSEVGHMNLGAGRVLYQDFTRITKDIRTGDFFEHEVLIDAVEKAKAANGALHIMGLLSEGGVHSHQDHIIAMCELALKRGAKVYLHAFLDGRDTPPRSAKPSLEKLDAVFAQYPNQGRIATMIGRYFAMDRDNRWDRVEQAYRLMTEGEALRVVDSAVEGKTQLRIAETEKYAHVTFFFSGGREDEYPGEKRILIPSPKVATYDLQPEMSAPEVTDKLVDAINSGEFDLLVVNYANGDMVGHTGVFEAAVKAVEAVDISLGRLYEAVMAKHGHMLITADHGNVEQMQDYLQLNEKSPAITMVRNRKLEVADIEPVMLHNQVLVLKVKVFQQDTANEIKRLIEEYSTQKVKAVLFDLRNNPGGLLSAAVETADLFLTQGTIVSTKSRSEGNQQFQALPGDESSNTKLGGVLPSLPNDNIHIATL
ncbi:unnamed protein product [Oppiella nova]|uniref:phosphoglycerate mutase (2,3-diphosphoglycerate-independent) n=1 Tax=Oppiella nova TaxID=334625 RepID=A0A7R9L8K4_9ACAR|nr:unnamed protein product [Oppiella nova]CAG2159535.1 unnamed protein product [Oppiella nova]